MAKKDSRVKVKVIFTIDVSVEDNLFVEVDTAEAITRQVFKESFSRAHLLTIDCTEILILQKRE